MATVVKTKDIDILNKNSKILFDANIWIYLFCDIANYNEFLKVKYSAAFKMLLKNRFSIFIDFSVMSEFVNRYLRIAYNNYRNGNGLSDEFKYKQYRKTDDFKEAWKNVCNIVRNKILPYASTVNFEYNKDSLLELLNLDNYNTDFNDNHIINLCRANNMYLLTNDADFMDTSIKIITENQNYWRN